MTNGESKVRFVSWTQFGQMLGSLSIAASLVLVAWEMMQARDIAEADLLTQQMLLNHEVHYKDSSPMQARLAIGKLTNNEGISIEQRLHLEAFLTGNIDELGLAFFKRNKGLLSEQAWLAQLEGFSFTGLCHPFVGPLMIEMWNDGRYYDGSFADFVNHHLEHLNCPNAHQQTESEKT